MQFFCVRLVVGISKKIMLNRIIRFSIQHKMVIGLMTIALIFWGAYSLKQLPIDAVPDITNNQVQVITTSPSNGAEDIERFITFPVEQTMSTIPHIEEIRSFSRFGLSVVTIVFKEHIDVYWARQQVNERLAEAREKIPDGMGSPGLAPLTTGLGEIYQYVVHTKPGYEKKYSVMELRTIQDWIIRRQLLGVEGIADVSSFGGQLKQYEIALDPEKLRSMGISIDEVFTALKKNNQNTGGAYLDKDPNAYFIRSEGLIGSKEDIENIAVKNTNNGIPILLRNVADIREGAAIRYGAMTRNDEGEVVGGIVLMLKGANSSQVIANVKERISQIEKTLPEGVVIEPFLDRTKLVNNAISTVTTNLAEGALIVIFVLVLLLGNLRAGLIVASVIPLSMLFAISLMNLFGVSGNLMSLGAIDFGLIVDGAVIIVEATLHHLVFRRKNQKLNQAEMDEEVFIASSRIRNSAAFGEIIILIVYLPILALVGIEGKMFRPMAQTVSFAILGAFLLSLTYVPMMSSLFLSKEIKEKRNISDRIMDFFRRIYAPALQFALRRKVLIISGTVLFFVASLFIFNRLGAEFIPTLEEGDFAVETRVMTGSSLSHTIDAAQKSSRVLLEHFPEIREVVGKIGSSEIPTDPMPVEACDLMIILKDKKEWTKKRSREELAQEMQEILEEHVPGVTYGFQQPIQMRFNELMSGARQDVVVKVYGEDLDKLTSYADKIGDIVRGIDGAKDVYIEQVSGLPQIAIKLHRDRIARFGLSVEDVNRAISTSFAGQSAGLVFEGEKRFDLVVRLANTYRQSPEDIRSIYVTTPGGDHIPLEQLAEVTFKTGPNQVQRDDAKRRIIVGFNVRGRDVESIVKELETKVQKRVKFDAGYYTTYGGMYENLQEATTRLSIAVPVALLFIFLLLYSTFQSTRQALLIFTAIPLSAIGGVFALWLRGMPFSISAGVGFIALFGVAVLNGIVLIGEFNRLRKEGLTDLKAIILQGTNVRLRPVIMTALVASLGFLPMAISGGSGAEVQRPLATVVIGGLISATLLTLLVLPILYMLFEQFKNRRMHLKKIMLVMLLLGANTMQAQTQQTLEQVIISALEKNRRIAIAMTNVEQQRQLKKAGHEIPKTNFNLMLGQYNSIAKKDNNFSITQSIPFPTVFSAQNRLGNSLIKESYLNVLSEKNELANQVRQAYYQLCYELAREKLWQTQDSILAELEKNMDLRYKKGEITLLEKTNASAQYQSTRNKLQQVRSELAIALSQLQVLINNPYPVYPSGESTQEHPAVPVSDTGAMKDHPQLRYLIQEIDVQAQQKSVLRSKALPDINVGYFNQTLIGYQNINGQDVYFDGSKRFQGFQVGLSIPIWYMPRAAGVKAARLQSELANLEAQQYKSTLQVQYMQAVQQYEKNKGNLEYYKTTVQENASMMIEHAQKAYRKGAIDHSFYLLTLKNAMDMKEGYLNAIYQYNLSAIQLEYLSGKF